MLHVKALALATLAGNVIGGMFYAPFTLLPLWMKENRKSGYAAAAGEYGEPQVSQKVWIAAFIANFLSSYAMEQLLPRGETIGEAAKVGAWFGIVLVSTAFALNYGFGARTPGLWAIDSAFNVVRLASQAAVLTYFR